MTYDFDSLVERKGTCCLKWDHLKESFGSADLHPMWVADMDFKAPPAVLDALQKRLDHGVFGYTFRDDAYHGIISDWSARRYGWPLKNEWITFSPGVVPALAMAVRAYSKPGERAVILTPVYPPFYSVVAKSGRELAACPLRYEAGRYELDFDALEAAMDEKTRLLLLCNPHNPAGRVWTREELLRIGEIAARHNLIIVSDEIHADFVFSGHTHIPIASLSEELAMRTVTCCAPSKTFGLAGLSTSYVVIPSKTLRDAYENELTTMDLDGGNIFGMVALEAAYTKCDEWLGQLLGYLEANRDYAISFLRERIPSIETSAPEGTYLLWLNCGKLGFSTGEELGSFLTGKAGLALNRGVRFGAQCAQFARLNFGCPRALLTEGLERLERAVNG